MLQCPKCGRTYDTDTQKFCTHDGGRLAPYDRAAAPTAYDLNQAVHTDPFDPEATVMRMPDLGKTVASAPTSEIRPKETGPAAAPPPPSQPQQPVAPRPPEQQPPAPREMMPTVAFNQPPPVSPPPQQQPYYPPPPAQPTSAPATPPSVQGPYAAAQPQYAPAPPQQYHHGAPPAQARKSSRAPLIVGLVVLVLLGGLAAWYFLVYKKGEPATANANTSANTGGGASANANTDTTANTNTAPAPPTPPANATEFVNSRANLDGKLAEYYSDFSFYYPNTWAKDPKAGVAGAGNFAKVDRQESPEFPLERFAVSYYESKGTFESDRSSFARLVQTYSDRFEPIYPNYRKVSEGETTVNGYRGYEFRFESQVDDTPKGDITYWGRVVFLPPGTEGQKNGVTLLMLTSSLAPELKSADDVGVKGELPVILNSFKLGSR